ncbi:MAG: fused MFS/spermidine synthase [Nitrospira sp.]|nr:fused MFS/spermidine synthase [Nitrospira sp.]
MAIVWAGTIFLSAFLLFLVQPMMAKMILPMLGGTPAVWNACMLFFQTTLLAGYGYVHLLNSWVAPRRQVVVHLVLLAVPLLLLPIGMPSGWTSPNQTNPVLWVLLLLTVAIGLPFFMLSTTAPLLQRWFSWTDHPSARDPYFLYAASNAGSMVALLGYPFVIEPWFPLRGTHRLSQTMLWSIGYGVLVALLGTCAWFLRHTHVNEAATSTSGSDTQAGAPLSPLPVLTRLRWILLAFIPSSLLLGATTHITLNVAAIPLLWVVPLALYLLSFILVFAKWSPANHRAMVMTLPVVLLLLIFDALPYAPSLPYLVQLLLPLVGLSLVAMVCHGELARTRPPTDRLTLFYLLMSIGGALGGLFNALIAPVVFSDIFEYDIILVLAACVLPRLEGVDPRWIARWSSSQWGARLRNAGDLAWVAGVAIVTGLCVVLSYSVTDLPILLDITLASVPLLLCYACVERPLRMGLALGAVLVTANVMSASYDDPVLYQTRSFFGVLKVKVDGDIHRLRHGTINHGMQRMAPEHRRESVSYFHPAGPYGQVFAAFSGPNIKKRIAITGLGIAALANYAEQGQSLTFYEIDPAVVEIAKNPRLFTYYNDAIARGVDLRVVEGDARLKMLEAPDGAYDMVILDAFTSDAIPVHLLTREAMEMYLRKLAPEGLLVIHISNRYLALEPVLANLGESLHLTGLKQFGESDRAALKYAADIVIMAREKEAFGALGKDPRWTPLQQSPTVGLWSDDFSNVVSAIKWSK